MWEKMLKQYLISAALKSLHVYCCMFITGLLLYDSEFRLCGKTVIKSSDAIIQVIFMSFSKAENITLSFWEAIKQYDITPFDFLIVFFATLHNIHWLNATLYLLVLLL